MAVRGLSIFDDLGKGGDAHLFGFAKGCADEAPTTPDLMGPAMRGVRTLTPGQPAVDDTGQLAALDI